MPVYAIPKELRFPQPGLAEPNGLLGVGGDLSPERLELAYTHGIFPWYSPGQPILWWSPDPRMVLDLSELHIPRSLKKRMRRGDFTLRLDSAFARVVEACARVPRRGQDGTWITEEMQQAYVRLHELGHAHSCEAWWNGELVGGLYGVCFGKLFSGESMFTRMPDASKIAFVQLCRQLLAWGFERVDCQVHTDHLARFGAREVPREVYLSWVARAGAQRTVAGPWQWDAEFFDTTP